MRNRENWCAAQPGDLVGAGLRHEACRARHARSLPLGREVMSNANSSGIWVSDLNSRPEVRSAFPKSTVRFYDTTLRDGEQTVGVVLSPQQKLEIARHLDALGICRIEAGFPKVSVDDAEAITLMLNANLKAELWGFSRAVQADVEELVRLGFAASGIRTPSS